VLESQSAQQLVYSCQPSTPAGVVRLYAALLGQRHCCGVLVGDGVVVQRVVGEPLITQQRNGARQRLAHTTAAAATGSPLLLLLLLPSSSTRGGRRARLLLLLHLFLTWLLSSAAGAAAC
jgi:hypothetical protein